MTYSPLYFNSIGKGSARQTITNFQNASGSTLTKGTPVSVNTSSQITNVNISSETSIQALVGLTGIDIPNAATGSVVDNGRLEDVTTSFSVGDALYINFDGTLTNVKPDLAVVGFSSGMFCVFIGVVVKNEFNPSLKDIKLMISVVGQL